MPSDRPLSRETFLYLADQAGLDTSSPHMNDLYPYVQSVLDSLKALQEVPLAGDEPDMAFLPNPD